MDSAPDPWTWLRLDREGSEAWTPVESCEQLLIVVGVTGVGKSTCLRHLGDRLSMALLPDRRSVADRVILPHMQQELGLASGPVDDRLERFRLTARYRDRFSGGVAHALSRLRLDASKCTGLVVFDGLRGTSEVSWAVEHFPFARFLALSAPGVVRLERLLSRDGDFDRAAAGTTGMSGVEDLFAELAGLEQLVTAEELGGLCATRAVAGLSPDAIAEKAAILLEEAKNYDPQSTLEVLQEKLGPWRLLSVDTSQRSAEEVAEAVKDWI